MLQNAYLLAKIGADTAENEQHFADNLPKIGNYPTVLDLLGRGRLFLCSQLRPLCPGDSLSHVRVHEPLRVHLAGHGRRGREVLAGEQRKPGRRVSRLTARRGGRVLSSATYHLPSFHPIFATFHELNAS